MSGPILRKYGFPNFDKIFGERPIQHGVEEEPAAEAEKKEATTDLEGNSMTKDEAKRATSGQMSPSTTFGSEAE